MSENKDSFEEEVKIALEKFRPQLQADGGDVEFVSVDDKNNVNIRLQGACNGCPMATMTIKMGIERYLKEMIPEVAEVIQVQ